MATIEQIGGAIYINKKRKRNEGPLGDPYYTKRWGFTTATGSLTTNAQRLVLLNSLTNNFGPAERRSGTFLAQGSGRLVVAVPELSLSGTNLSFASLVESATFESSLDMSGAGTGSSIANPTMGSGPASPNSFLSVTDSAHSNDAWRIYIATWDGVFTNGISILTY